MFDPDVTDTADRVLKMMYLSIGTWVDCVVYTTHRCCYLLFATLCNAVCLLCSVLQGKAVVKFVDAITEKSLRTTVAMTAGRGRGKSAALGLSIAAAVAYQ